MKTTGVEPLGELRRSPAGVEWLAVPGWELDWLWHGFSTRRGGVSRVYGRPDSMHSGSLADLNLGFTPADDRNAVEENRRRFVEALTDGEGGPMTLVRQIHSNCSVRVSGGWEADGIPAADGLVTDEPGKLIGVQTADCIPVLLVDPEHRAVGAFHAGWRGTVERIVELGVARMRAEFGSVPEKMLAAIGPGIGVCCYRVGDEVKARFGANFSYADELFTRDAGGGMRLDLVEANRRQLLDAGFGENAITVAGGCTSCLPEYFFSHRASGGVTGRMVAAIGVRGTV